MKLTTKNIDKTIRMTRRLLAGEKVTVHPRCFGCGKKLKTVDWIAVLNGFGGFNKYHTSCFLEKL